MRIVCYLTLFTALSAGMGYAQSPSDIDCIGNGFTKTIGSSAAAPPGNTEIRIKTDAFIGGWVSGGSLFIKADGPVKIPFEYINRDSNSYSMQNYFVIYSPDGATWEHATADGGNYKASPTSFGIWIDTTGFYPKSDFGGVYKIGLYGADGAGRDTLRFLGAPNDPSQLGGRPLDSGINFYAIIRPKLSDTGKHICIDSVDVECGCTWRWPSFNYSPSYTSPTAWKGPWCFTVAYSCCQGLAGNYDNDPEDRCDISDVTAFIARYTTLEMPSCAGEANVDGSPDGNSDISDLTALIDYLYISFTPPAPCR